MRHPHPGSFHGQATLLRRQFLQDGDLPFTGVLTEDTITKALAVIGGGLDRGYSPLVTPWVFLGQVLSAHHSCRAPVAPLIPPPVAPGQPPRSPAPRPPCPAPPPPPPTLFSGVA